MILIIHFSIRTTLKLLILHFENTAPDQLTCIKNILCNGFLNINISRTLQLPEVTDNTEKLYNIF